MRCRSSAGTKYGRYGATEIGWGGSARPPGSDATNVQGAALSGRTLHLQLASDHTAGVMSPSNPSASWLGPAVKYSALGVMLSEPVGNRKPQSPGMVIGPCWLRS
jgi:hypothetical protein